MKRYIVELALAIALVIVSAAHLHLYYVGAWYDPSRIIELGEVAFLYAFIILGASYTIWRKCKHWKEGD